MDLFEKLFYNFVIFLSRIVFLPTISEIRGLENLPRNGGFIIASNHVNCFDPFLIIAAISGFLKNNYFKRGKKFYYIGMTQLKKRIYSFFLNEKLGFLPNSVEGAQRSVELLKKGNIVGIFPEGRRNDNVKLLEAKKGVAYMALLSGAPVVPVACFGPKTRSFNQGLKGLLCTKKVYFGETIRFSERSLPEIKSSPGFLLMVLRLIMSEIGELWGKSYEF